MCATEQWNEQIDEKVLGGFNLFRQSVYRMSIDSNQSLWYETYKALASKVAGGVNALI